MQNHYRRNMYRMTPNWTGRTPRTFREAFGVDFAPLPDRRRSLRSRIAEVLLWLGLAAYVAYVIVLAAPAG